MPFLNKLGYLIFVSVSFSLVGCTQQPFTSVDRNTYKTVAFKPEIKAPEHYVYHDTTGKVSRGMSVYGGLIGAALGAAIGAASEAPGFHRFDAAASKNPIDIRLLMRRHTEAALKISPMRLVSTDADTTFELQIHSYGVGPVNGRDLGAVIAARGTLLGRDGQLLWSKDEWATSNTATSLENLEQNPKLWPQMANEAAEALAKKLVLYSEPSKRSAAEPLM